MREPTSSSLPRDADESDLVDLLAPLHADALRLARRGIASCSIAARLGIPDESVAGVLEMAAAKLARLQREGSPR